MKDFKSEETPITNFNRNSNLIPLSRQTVPEKSDAIIPFPEEPDYAVLEPVTPTQFIPPIRRWVSISGIIMVSSFVAAIGLSTILKYKVTVQAPAAVRPVGELRLVQSTMAGSVLSIAVRENQVVKKGDPIATVKDLRLENKLQTKLDQLAGDSRKAKQQLQAIDAQIGASDRQNVAEIDRTNRSIAGIESELSRAQRDHRDKRITTQSEVAEAEANWKAARREQQAAELELKVTEANLKSLQASYQSAFTRSQRYKNAGTAGAISTNLLEEARLTTEQQAQAIVAQQATILKQQQIVARNSEAVVAAATRIQRTQAALNPSKSDSITIVQKIAGEQASGKAAVARLQQDRLKLLQQRVEVVNQIATNDRDIAEITTELQPIPILAPVSGTIQELSLRNNLQVVQIGDRLAQIIPTGTPLNIKALVAISDISNVKVGQTVQMRVSACPYTDYGVAPGTVTEISADAKSLAEPLLGRIEKNPTQQSQTAANSGYEVTIKPTNLSLKRGRNTCQIRAGMDGRADIISKEESVWQFMLKKARLLSI